MNVREMFLTPRQFLLIGGSVLVLIAVLGFVGVIGPGTEDSVFGSAWWFDNGENWAHLVLGVVGLVSAFVVPATLQRWLVLVLGIFGVLVGIYSIFTAKFLGANLENPADTLLHIIVGGWALACSIPRGSMAPHATPR